MTAYTPAIAKTATAQKPTVTSAQRLMVRQRYPEAAAQIKAILKNDPSNIDALYTLATIEQTRILDYETFSIDGKRFHILADSVKKAIEARLPDLRGADSARALLYCANLVGGISVMQTKNGEWVGGAKNASASVEMFKQVKKADPDNLAAELGIGTFDYYLGTTFKWVPFVTDASAERGFQAVARAQKAPFPFNHAAKSTYCWILIDRKQFAKADSVAHAAIAELPGNTTFLRIRAFIYLWTGGYNSAIRFSEKIIAAAQGRTPVNWSDIVTGYHIIVNAYENLDKKAEACAAAGKILDMPIPAEYRNMPHIKENLKHISGVRSKCKQK